MQETQKEKEAEQKTVHCSGCPRVLRELMAVDEALGLPLGLGLLLLLLLRLLLLLQLRFLNGDGFGQSL